MHCTIDKKFVLPMHWYSNKLFRNLSQGVWVEEPGIKKIKSLMNMNERVVLIPQYKSFADLFIMLYTFKVYGIEIPFTVGNLEDTPRVPLIDRLLKGIGYIHARRSRDQSMQESYLTQAIIREILSDEKLLVMFQNDERMRSGRFNQPTVADISIEWLMQAYLSSLQREGKNLYLIPVAINYDRLFEIRNLANEIVSGETGDFSMLDVRKNIKQQGG